MSYKLWQIPVTDRKKIFVRYHETLGSTNREAVNLAREGAAEWTVVGAAEQTAGRGRYQREWISPAGAGLWFSVILRPKLKINFLNLISLTTAVILRNFIAGIIQETSSVKKNKVALKWPNDILLNKKKIGGLLFESGISAQKLNYVIAGIGINVHQSIDDFPCSLRETAISLKMATAKKWELRELLDRCLKFYYQEYRQAELSHFKNIILRYEKYLLFKNKSIKIQFPTKEMTGILRGINQFGHLLLERGGQVSEITSGDLWTIKKVKQK
jgi:BirA family biotin operon repressor/biotin-[acetyl-CoA-carboxylase] ligase